MLWSKFLLKNKFKTLPPLLRHWIKVVT